MAITVTEMLRRRFGGKSLPYDAEVEFLQSSGTQYIDCGITGNLETEVEVSFNASASGKYLFGSRSNTTTCITLYISSTATQRFDSKSATRTITFDTDHIISIGKTKCILDGNIAAVNAKSSFTTPANLYLMDVSGSSQSATSGYQGKVYYCKIWDNGSLVRDMIPVRKGTTGYMYDKVSGQLFSNAGTGDFILGNDI